VHFYFQPYYIFTLSLYLAYDLFLHLLSTNHKCIQSCYFSLLLKPAAQKMKMVWNSSTRSSRLALSRLHIPVDYGAFRCSPSVRESFSLLKYIIYVIIILYS
jgi:hypothetical protein